MCSHPVTFNLEEDQSPGQLPSTTNTDSLRSRMWEMSLPHSAPASVRVSKRIQCIRSVEANAEEVTGETPASRKTLVSINTHKCQQM